jgi:hypothetical protein
VTTRIDREANADFVFGSSRIAFGVGVRVGDRRGATELVAALVSIRLVGVGALLVDRPEAGRELRLVHRGRHVTLQRAHLRRVEPQEAARVRVDRPQQPAREDRLVARPRRHGGDVVEQLRRRVDEIGEPRAVLDAEPRRDDAGMDLEALADRGLDVLLHRAELEVLERRLDDVELRAALEEDVLAGVHVAGVEHPHLGLEAFVLVVAVVPRQLRHRAGSDRALQELRDRDPHLVADVHVRERGVDAGCGREERRQRGALEEDHVVRA